MRKSINPYCSSSYLALRYVFEKKQIWNSEWTPWWPKLGNLQQTSVKNEDEIISVIKQVLSDLTGNCGILLSGGIDSAILAAFMPKGSHAYTIRFISENSIDESIYAAKYAEYLGLNHNIVDVEWDDYTEFTNTLMSHKRSPLHAIEVAIYKASLAALKDGINCLVVGNGADSTFGGMDKLLSKDWGFDEFKDRYTFVDPKMVLKDSVDTTDAYLPFKINKGIDVIGFLKKVHGDGIIQTFCNGAETAGVKLIEPFEMMDYPYPLDLNRIRNGESKYLLRSIFKRLYPSINIPEKIPFARPMDEWLKDWEGPEHKIFKNNIDIHQYTGDQKWLIYNLNQFANLISTT